MKNIGLALFVLILSITLIHSGKTDANGGHWDHSTGEYHYHHGYPAHQHPNGVCPYNFDDATRHQTSLSIQEKTLTNSNPKSSSEIKEVLLSLGIILFLHPFGWAILWLVWDRGIKQTWKWILSLLGKMK